MVEGLIGARRLLSKSSSMLAALGVLWAASWALVPQGSSCLPRAMLLVTGTSRQSSVLTPRS